MVPFLYYFLSALCLSVSGEYASLFNTPITNSVSVFRVSSSPKPYLCIVKCEMIEIGSLNTMVSIRIRESPEMASAGRRQQGPAASLPPFRVRAVAK